MWRQIERDVLLGSGITVTGSGFPIPCRVCGSICRSHLCTVEVGNEPIVILNLERKIRELRGVGSGKGYATVHARILVPHGGQNINAEERTVGSCSIVTHARRS